MDEISKRPRGRPRKQPEVTSNKAPTFITADDLLRPPDNPFAWKKADGTPLLPSPAALGMPIGTGLSLDAYFTVLAKSSNPEVSALSKALDPQAIFKALDTPPSAYSFSRLSYMPDPQAGGLLSWPGISPPNLTRLARTTLAPEMIIGMRVEDVLSFSNLSNHPWRRGWKIEMRDVRHNPSKNELREIREAERFILNCNIETSSTEVRKRDAQRYSNFKTFLSAATRDSLTVDGLAIFTDMENSGRVKGFTNLPAGNIRLAAPEGYLGNPDHFACLVDEGGAVKQPFTRDELTFVIRNPRTDADIGGAAGGYGWSELEMGMKLIESFQNAIELNCDTFSKSGMPNAMLILKGSGWTQDQLDALSRQWSNLKRGISKFWALPALVMNDPEGSIEMLDFSAAKGKDALYQDHLNLTVGTFATLYQFPIKRLGYRITGKGPEVKDQNDKTAHDLVDEEDIGGQNLLDFLAETINQYLLWSRFPDLNFIFVGTEPKNEAREYEIRTSAMTYGEVRAEVDLENLEKITGDLGDEEKWLLKIMQYAPMNPVVIGAFSSIALKLAELKFGVSQNGVAAGPAFNAKIDPAQSEKHGDISGVRRNRDSSE